MTAGADRAAWTPGDTVQQRFIRLDGSAGQIHPLRVIADDGDRLLGWLPLDTPLVATRLVGGQDQRSAPLAERFVRPRERFLGRWTETSTLRLVDEAHWSSVWWFFRPDGEFTNWYVNLEVPLGRTDSTVDRCDGVLDIEVSPDLRWRWKDEDEAAAAVGAGRFTPTQMAALRAEGDRLIALAEAGRYPFDGTHCEFRPGADWSPPALDVPADLVTGGGAGEGAGEAAGPGADVPPARERPNDRH